MYDLYFIITLSTALAALAGMYVFRWRDYRLFSQISPSRSSETPPPGISIVLPAKHLSERTDECLAELMKQEYPVFEVIVVEELPTKEAADHLKQLKKTYPSLRYTAVPVSSRYIDRRKMALTLGVRAAHHPWVVFTQDDCKPASPHWLDSLARHFDQEANIVIGYANYADTGTRRAGYAILVRLCRQLQGMRAMQKGNPFTADACNLAIRKDFFLGSGGFQNTLRFPFDSLPLFVARFGTHGGTRAEMNAESTVLQELPSSHDLRTESLGHCEAGRHSSRRGKRFALRDSAASVCCCLFWWTVVIHMALRACETLLSQEYTLRCFAFDGPLLVGGIMAIALPALLLRKSTNALEERGFGGFMILWHELARPVKNISLRLFCLSLRRHWCRSPLPAQQD